MQTHDLVIIGAGEAGQAAAHLARHRGASVAIVERELFGGSCPYWACMPSKALLHAAAMHVAGGTYPWQRASDFRDWMINREGIDWPDDSTHVTSLKKAGVTVLRGDGRIDGPGRVAVASEDGEQVLGARAILIAVGTNATIPNDIMGLDQIEPWTNRQATTARAMPRSLVIVGAGPTGVEMAQVYARYGVPTVLVASHERINPNDHPLSSAAVDAGLRRDGVDIRTATRVSRVRPAAGRDGTHAVDLMNGSTVEGHEILLAVGRTAPLRGLGLETVGVQPDDNGRLVPDDRLRLAEGVYVAGDPAGPEMHTHLAVYQGELAARIALGEDVRPDYRAIPHAIYTDPQAAGVGLQLAEAATHGLDAFEETTEYATTAPGYIAEAQGHVTIVADRRDRVLLGAFIAAPGAADAIGESVLAIKLRTPLEVLADTIHPFPTTVRVMGSLFARAAARTAR